MRNFIFLLILLFPFSVYAQGNSPSKAGASPVLIELFSSQGCPACPPADAYMKNLAASEGVIALSCHVDYFPVPNDALGKLFCTKRQTVYKFLIGRKTLYTPQMMINGHIDAVGYDKEKVSASIVKARSEKVQDIRIQSKGSGVYEFALTPKNLKQGADLWLAVYRKPVTVNRRGQNITYYNTVSHFLPLGKWQGGAINRAVFPLVSGESAGFAVVAQDLSNGKVIAAGNYKL